MSMQRSRQRYVASYEQGFVANDCRGEDHVNDQIHKVSALFVQIVELLQVAFGQFGGDSVHAVSLLSIGSLPTNWRDGFTSPDTSFLCCDEDHPFIGWPILCFVSASI